MGVFLTQFTTLVIAGFILVNVGSITTNAILDAATDTANAANVRQLSTAIELYHLDHNAYPSARTGDQLVNTLYTEGYIENKPADASVFAYEKVSTGDAYSLKSLKRK
ncbi:MAG: type II secretion system protein GspG [Candidatus Moraniibacteriota bacterium]